MAKKNNEVLDATETDAVAPEEASASEKPSAREKPAAAEPPVVSGAVQTIEDDFGDEPLDQATIVAMERSKARRRAIFIVLFIVAVVAVGVFFALQSGMLQGACAGLEPGIHKLDDG